MAISLLIADDHQWVREGLQYAFANTEVEIVAEATCGETAARLAIEEDVDVVLMDHRLPNGDGLEALTRIKTAKADLPILVYSADDRPDLVQRCAVLGASGFLRKGVARQVLVDAVRNVFMGKDVWDLANMAAHSG